MHRIKNTAPFCAPFLHKRRTRWQDGGVGVWSSHLLWVCQLWILLWFVCNRDANSQCCAHEKKSTAHNICCRKAFTPQLQLFFYIYYMRPTGGIAVWCKIAKATDKTCWELWNVQSLSGVRAQWQVRLRSPTPKVKLFLSIVFGLESSH